MNEYQQEDDRQDAEWEMAQERQKKRAMRIWRDEKAEDQVSYYEQYLARRKLVKEFNEWLVNEINADYPEEG